MLLPSLLNNLIFISKCYPTFREIVRGHIHSHSISRKYLYIVHSHLCRNVGCYNMPVFPSSTRNIAFDNASVITPSCSIEGCFAIIQFLQFPVSIYSNVDKIFSFTFSDSQRMLEMCGGQMISGLYCPSVRHLENVTGSHINHGLNSNHHSDLQFASLSSSSIVRDLRLFMQALSHAMTNQFSDDRESIRFSIRSARHNQYLLSAFPQQPVLSLCTSYLLSLVKAFSLHH